MATLAQRILDLATRISAEIKALRLSRPRGFVLSISGKTLAGEIFPTFAPYAYASTTARSFARARVAFTAATVFVIKRNGTQVATVTFSAGATVGTWSADVAWADGDFITIEAPATPDATGAEIVIGARE